MTWLDPGHPVAALVAFVGCALVALLVPRLIALVPEPEPEPEPEPDPGPGPELHLEPVVPKILYADIAARPGLAVRTALASGLGGAVVAASVGGHWPLLVLLPAVPVCVALSVIDLHTRLLPSRLLLPAHAAMIGLAVVAALVDDDTDALVRAVVAMVVVRSIFWVLWWVRSSGMGFGDVRLAALLSFGLGYLGWAEVVIGVYAAFIVFVVPGLVVAAVRRDRAFLRSRIPFGPFLVLGAAIGIAVGPWIARSLGY